MLGFDSRFVLIAFARTFGFVVGGYVLLDVVCRVRVFSYRVGFRVRCGRIFRVK